MFHLSLAFCSLLYSVKKRIQKVDGKYKNSNEKPWKWKGSKIPRNIQKEKLRYLISFWFSIRKNEVFLWTQRVQSEKYKKIFLFSPFGIDNHYMKFGNFNSVSIVPCFSSTQMSKSHLIIAFVESIALIFYWTFLTCFSLNKGRVPSPSTVSMCKIIDIYCKQCEQKHLHNLEQCNHKVHQANAGELQME